MKGEENQSQRVSLRRAQRRREDGVSYTVRVIPRSGGMLELVEERPKNNPFHEWARAMQYTGFYIF